MLNSGSQNDLFLLSVPELLNTIKAQLITLQEPLV